MVDTLVFPPHQGLPYDHIPPTVDGLCEFELGLPLEAVTVQSASDPIEGGWKGAARITYGGASGLPAASVQALKHQNGEFIFLSFTVRFDLNYDGTDAILIYLQDQYSDTTAGNIRRLVIRPLLTNVGAGLASEPAGPVDITATLPSYQDPATQYSVPIRNNHRATVQLDKWVPAAGFPNDTTQGSWTTATLGQVGPGENAPGQIRARSWQISATTDNCWSIEVMLPTTQAGAGAAYDWINLAPAGFGLYFNVIRVGAGSLNLASSLVVEFPWPRQYTPAVGPVRDNVITDEDSPGGFGYNSYADIFINLKRLGRAALSGTMTGVTFDHDAATAPHGPIYVQQDGNILFDTWAMQVDTTGTRENQFFAAVKYLGTPAATPPNVFAQLRVARFGIRGPGLGDWDLFQPDTTISAAPNKNPTDPAPIGAGTNLIRVNWRLTQAQHSALQSGGMEKHQCIGVFLDSTDSTDFVESSLFVNTFFEGLSRKGSQIVVSGRGYEKPVAGGDHEFLLVNSTRLMTSTVNYDGWDGRKPGDGSPDEREPIEPVGVDEKFRPKWGKTTPWLGGAVFGPWSRSREVNYTWVVITVAYHRTAQTLTLGGTKRTLYNVADSCSHVLHHEGDVGAFRQSWEGPGLTRLGDGIYSLPVPHDGEVVINASFEAMDPDEVDGLDRLLALIDKILALLDRLAACGDRLDPLHALLVKLARGIRLLPLPADVRKALARLLERVAGVREKMRVLTLLRHVLTAIEHHLEQLDRILDRLRPIDPATRKELLAKLFGGDADRIGKEIEALEAYTRELAARLDRLTRILDILGQLAETCHQIDGLYALLRGLGRMFEKLSALGSGLGKRFPFLERILPSVDPAAGAIGKQLDLLARNGALLEEILKLLEQLGEPIDALQAIDRDLDALAYEETARAAEQLYKAAFG
ncbi:hypothetical protein [Sorangium sp. So ce887]|uniref:hypothetical protein n=1 Tax=Sorangium sp. So ce887 TaxID=3133324 RepID=UPI003F5FF390